MAAMIHPLRVATWNIHEGLPVDDGVSSAQALKQIAALVSDLEIDVLGLQEVNFGPSEYSAALATLTAETTLTHVAHYILSESSFFPADRAGVAIASRYPLTNLQRIKFENPGLTVRLEGKVISTHDKGMLSASVILPDRIVSAASLHAFPFHIFEHCASDSQFAALWEKLGNDLGGLGQGSTVICGDFNTDDRDLLIRQGRAELRRVNRDLPTYKDKFYDDILFSAELTPSSVQTVENFSDHRLCLAELTWTA
jgi:endonuclease/exonuclease/phosphatase family metal-dependent hydrolase